MFSKKLSLIYLVTILFISLNLTAQDDKNYEETFSFDPSGTVSINTYKGSITVETWDKAEVYFHAEVQPDENGWNSTSPEEQMERCRVIFDHSNDYLSLKSDYKEDHGHNSETLALVHYKIKIPATAKLRIEDYKSKTQISNLNSSIDLETYKGVVDIDNYSGDIDLETYKGSVKIDFTSFDDNCKLDTYKGDIYLALPSNSKFDFDFELDKKGDFTSDFDMSMNGYRSDDGEINGSVNGGGKEIKFSTYKGEIELRKK